MGGVHSDDVHAVDEEVVDEPDITSLVGYGGYNLCEFFHKRKPIGWAALCT